MTDIRLTTDNRPIIARDESGTTYTVSHMEVKEGLSELFYAKLTLIASPLKCEKILGKAMTVTYQPGLNLDRTQQFVLNGIVSRINGEAAQNTTSANIWSVELRPWLSLLAYRQQCRIFQNMSVAQIIDSVCSDYSVSTGLRFSGSNSNDPRLFCVQYNETDLAFIERLLAEEGLHYHFRHSEDAHELLIGADNQVFQLHGSNTIEYVATAADKFKSIDSWNPSFSVQQQDSLLHGYNREKAAPIHSRQAKSANSSGGSTASGFSQWNSRLVSQSESDNQSLYSIHRADSHSRTISATSSLPSLRAGSRFKLESHPNPEQQGEYYVIQACHSFEASEQGRQKEYRNQLEVSDFSSPFRSPVTSKPVIQGVQTAIVSGPDDQEIYTDGQGCVKVRFHWDSSDNGGDNCSAWIPVTQPLSGKSFGVSFLPRVGQEVVVAFVDGDPDQPVITGCLYNGAHETPFDTDSVNGLKSCSTPSGSEGHEAWFDDSKDNEMIFIKSQKDLQLDINNDMTTNTLGNRTEQIEKDFCTMIKQNYTVKAEQTVTSKSGQSYTMQSDSEISITAGTSTSMESKTDTTIKASKVAIEAQTGISLKCGACEISLSPSGINIKGPMVTVEAQSALSLKGLSAELKGTTQTSVSGLVIDVNANTCLSLKGSAMVMIQGGLTKIN